ncbi:MAG: putative toxin-antitoxin system toxin component, PIN family [Chlorobiaceae bacterium]|nr:putative toxin-antitoxin system toxin component, PIN family [Chlorobiaceae bacterium]
MRVVCDTNVLVSGILFVDNPRELLRLCSSGTLTNFTSPELLREIEHLLIQPKFGLNEELYGIIRLFRDTFFLVIPETRICIITADPDDNRVLESASSARAEAIVSNDTHLLELKEWNGIVIVTPADFLKNFFVG